MSIIPSDIIPLQAQLAPGSWVYEDVKRSLRTVPDGFRILLHRGSDPDWSARCRAAFEFFRAHSSRRYSNDSLMRLLNLEYWDAGENSPEPVIISLEVDYSFDPVTEVKTGGTLGSIAQLNDGTKRALLAVAEPARENGVGSALLRLHSATLGLPALWVARTNAAAMRFLLANGMYPVAINARGQVRFGYEEPLDD